MLSNSQLREYREQLKELSLSPISRGENQHEEERKLIDRWRAFVPDKPVGRQIYGSFSDEELIAVLKEAYGRLGRAPVQRDIFCFYRTYIKHRFVTWTEALQAAGLNYSLEVQAPKLSEEEYERVLKDEPETYALLVRLLERRAELGYPPRRKDFSESRVLKERFESWGNVLGIAEGMDQWLMTRIDDSGLLPEPAVNLLLQELKATAERLGRTPLKEEIAEETRCRLRICFGAWNSVLRAAGLEPLEGNELEHAMWDCRQRRKAGTGKLYRVPDPEPEYRVLLEELNELAETLGRAPLKEEMASEKRAKLQERFGSWRNALYQIGAEALTKQETAKAKKKKRDIVKKGIGEKR